MSGIRLVSLSRGAHNSNQSSDLTRQLLAGQSNSIKCAKKEALKQRRRPITNNMLRVLQHAIASHSTWSEYEKSLRWSALLLCWWGSFRMGELIGERKTEFNESSSLLPSDLKFDDDKSVVLWVRNAKIYVEGGEIIEVWRVQECPDLDPVKALRYFLTLRSSVFGLAEDLPVFMHETGSIFTKATFNKDLLAMFPALSSSPLDKWSGHSCRSGISTLLISLGFSKAICIIHSSVNNCPSIGTSGVVLY